MPPVMVKLVCIHCRRLWDYRASGPKDVTRPKRCPDCRRFRDFSFGDVVNAEKRKRRS